MCKTYNRVEYIDIISLNISVGAGYITTRGCAPFDTETFSVNLQRGMAGTYWKSYDAFSLCENALCNSAPPMIKSYSILLGFILSLFCINL